MAEDAPPGGGSEPEKYDWTRVYKETVDEVEEEDAAAAKVRVLLWGAYPYLRLRRRWARLQ